MALGCTTVSQDRLQAPSLIRCLSLFFRREDRSHAMGNNTSFSHFLVTSKLFLQILTSKIQFIKGADRWKIEILQLVDTLISSGDNGLFLSLAFSLVSTGRLQTRKMNSNTP